MLSPQYGCPAVELVRQFRVGRIRFLAHSSNGKNRAIPLNIEQTLHHCCSNGSGAPTATLSRRSTACNDSAVTPSDYLDYSGRADALSGGARMISIETPSGPYRVWTKRTATVPT